MQDKQKVTLYLSPGLHRKLKIRSAVDSEPMSSLVERALVFYLANPGVVEEVEASQHGRTHQVYACPECASSLVLREGELEVLGSSLGVLPETEDSLSVKQVQKVGSSPDQQGEEELVPC
jgi:hypothetical protein